MQSVEIRDVIIPPGLEDAMSKQAQAERERQARIILGTVEMEIAEKFVEAARPYVNNPVAVHLRAMNMLYEGLKEKGSIVVVPSSAVTVSQNSMTRTVMPGSGPASGGILRACQVFWVSWGVFLPCRDGYVG